MANNCINAQFFVYGIYLILRRSTISELVNVRKMDFYHCVGIYKKKKGWIEILPRFKIQYPMKNRGKGICSISIKQ